MRHVRVLGVDFNDQSIESAVAQLQNAIREQDQSRSVYFPNAATLNLAASDPSYRDVLRSSDFVYADGTGIRWAARMRGVKHLSNLNGTDVIPALLTATPGLRAYLLGGTEEVNSAAAEAVLHEFPDIVIAGRHHGFFDFDESADVVAAINATNPDILLVGFGNPLQEEWIARNRPKLRVPLIAGVGGLFGFWAGTRTRAAGFTRRIGMEWADILIREPSKARRYLLGNPTFLYRALRARQSDLRV